MHKWYVVQVVSGQEKKVKRALEENAAARGMSEHLDAVLVPAENVAETKAGKQRIVEKKLWPGYVLIKLVLNEDSWMYVRDTSGVLGFLGGDQPVALTEHEMEQMLSDLEEKKKEVVQKHNIAPGDRVKITEGVFVNFIGNVLEVFHDKGTLSVMVSIFGRETRVDDLEFWQVELMPVEAT